MAASGEGNGEVIWFFGELLRTIGTTTYLLIFALLWTFVVPIVRSRLHVVHRIILGLVSMIVWIGWIGVVLAAMWIGNVLGGSNNNHMIFVFFIASVVTIWLPFQIASMAEKGKRRAANSVAANEDV